MKPYKSRMSFAHHQGMRMRLIATLKELHALGYEPTQLKGLKPKHIEALVKYWQDKNLNPATIKNRMADLRFVCCELKKSNIIKPNDAYQIPNRQYVPEHNRAIPVIDVSEIEDPHLRISLELQRHFGLRREECIKIIPSQADQGSSLFLKNTWTKGGIERYVPVQTDEQRHWLNQAKQLAGEGNSLIPKHKTYIQQRNVYEFETRKLGLHNLHGLRHAYAQKRYKELTGFESPINGGKTRNQMTSHELHLDRKARQALSGELGHYRDSIVKNYCG